mmetsp:Transcript_29113/g.60691  ORF Transcript_29113/g.60691 Transcript_29113/m.60691 type:complete len:330 (-) Transcript_29113:67-1056(-)
MRESTFDDLMASSESPTPSLATATKRPHSSIVMSSSSTWSSLLQNDNELLHVPKRLKRSRNKSIQFSSNVSMRCFVQHYDSQYQQQHQDQNHCSPSCPPWIKRDQVDEEKRQTKALSKMWRSKNTTANNTDNIAIIGSAVRCSIEGESLRGLEHVTHPSIGRDRRRVRDTAIHAAVREQREQLVRNVMDAYLDNNNEDDSVVGGDNGEERSAREDRAMSSAMKMDNAKLAKVYGAEAREALAYARRVAKEDAEVAAEILAQDLTEEDSSPSSITVGCNRNGSATLKFPEAESIVGIQAHDTGAMRVTEELIQNFLQNMVSRHQNVAIVS